MGEATRDRELALETLLVLELVLREGDRLPALDALKGRLFDRLALDTDARVAIAAGVDGLRARFTPAGRIAALRGLSKDERRRLADAVMAFADTDPLLAPSVARLRARVADMLALD